jgi:adenylate kinase
MTQIWGRGKEDVAGPDAVILLDAPREVLIERLLVRAKVEGRSDDTPEVVRRRLREFDETTRPLVEYYRARGLLRSIDASRGKDEVTSDILAALPTVGS